MTGSKARWKRLLAYMLAFAMVFSSAAVSSFGTATVQAASKSIKSVKVQLKVGSKDVTKKTITLGKGCKVNVDAIVRPKSAKKSPVKFASAKKSVATVNKNGIITGKKVGTAKINVTATGKDNKKVTTYVKVKVVNVSLKLNKKNASLNVGKTTTLKATVTPKDSKVTWSTSNKSVATVTKKGVVKGVKAGTATITAKAGTKKATCKVTVKAATSSVAVTDVQISTKTAEINVGGITNMNASVLPANATDKTLKYESSNPSVATVDAAGAIVGVGAGTATITARSANGKSASMQVTVKFVNATGVTVSPNEVSTLGIGSVRTLEAIVAPAEASNKTVSWSSDAPAIATVEKDTGKVTGIAEGTATITATTEDGGFTATCQVKVVKNDGIDIRLENPYKGIEGNTNTVLYGDNMHVAVTLTNGDAPAAGESVVLTLKDRGYNTWGQGLSYKYEVKNKVETTDTNGRAMFVVGPRDGVTNADILNEEYAFVGNLVVTRTKTNDGSDITQKELTVNTATIATDGIQVLNRDKINPADEGKADWKAPYTTYALYANTSSENKLAQEYVVSQKVSPAGTTDNQIEFSVSANLMYGDETKEVRDSYVWPEEGTDEKTGSTVTSIYSASSNTSTQVQAKDIPEGINNLRVNFRKIDLSDFSAIYVTVYGSKGEVVATRTITSASNLQEVTEDNEGGQRSIQLGDLDGHGKLRLVVSLETKGQIKDGGEGYIVAKIIGSYANGKLERKPHPISTDKYVEWTDVSNQVSYETTLVKSGDDYYYDVLSDILPSDALGANKEYEVRIPAFPYTGDAFISVKGGYTYLYPTENSRYSSTKRNINVINPQWNDTTNRMKQAIRITNEEEAGRRQSVDTTTSSNSLVVNSEKTGMTALKAKITIPGIEEDVFNEQNGQVLYTSVQWAPVTRDASATTRNEYYAVEGQGVRIVAQLCDINGNAVSAKDKKIKITAENTDFTTWSTEKRGIIKDVENTRTGQVNLVYNSRTPNAGVWDTDENGKVVIELQGVENTAVVRGLRATNDEFRVKLSIVDGKGNLKEEITTNDGNNDIYWVDLGLEFIDSTNNGYRVVAFDKTTQNDQASRFTAGKKWTVGYRPIVSKNGLDSVKNTNLKEIKTDTVAISYEISSNDIIEANTKDGKNPPKYLNSNGNNSVDLTSDEIGHVFLSGWIKSTESDLAGITFVTAKGEKKNIGIGDAISQATTLKHEIIWVGEGTNKKEEGFDRFREIVSGNTTNNIYIGLADDAGRTYPDIEVTYWFTRQDNTVVDIDAALVSSNSVSIVDGKISGKTAIQTDTKNKNGTKRGYIAITPDILNQLPVDPNGYVIEAEFSPAGLDKGQVEKVPVTFSTFTVKGNEAKASAAPEPQALQSDDPNAVLENEAVEVNEQFVLPE